jgi:predicted RNA binding protein YcfA (HicA-like mRNA interferase family)
MAKIDKLIQKILQGQADANINFEELCGLLKSFGFVERISGSHHIYRRGDVEERLNLQRDGAKAKPYQVRQIRALILKYRLRSEDNA